VVVMQTTFQAEPIKPYKRLYSLEEFFAMSEAGLFKNQRVELINGEVIVVPAQGPKHAGTIALLIEVFRDSFKDKAVVWAQLPIVFESKMRDYVEPDIALLALPREQYTQRFVFPQDAYLVVEVSVSSLEDDRTDKLQMYAKHGIQEYWIVNVEEQKLEVYRNPAGEKYHSLQILNLGQTIAPLEFPQHEIRWW
jgi:Uma2 family endonuclease